LSRLHFPQFDLPLSSHCPACRRTAFLVVAFAFPAVGFAFLVVALPFLPSHCPSCRRTAFLVVAFAFLVVAFAFLVVAFAFLAVGFAFLVVIPEGDLLLSLSLRLPSPLFHTKTSSSRPKPFTVSS
jgi:hypothetical protein